MEFIIDPVEGVEPISAIPIQLFLQKIFIEKKRLTIDKAKTNQANLAFWYNRSKLDQEIKAVIVLKWNNKWFMQKVILCKNKKIFDMEI